MRLRRSVQEENRRPLLNRLFSFRTFYLFILFAAILIVCGAIYLKLIGNGNLAGETWRHFILWIAKSGESYLNRALFTHSPFIDHAAAFMLRAIMCRSPYLDDHGRPMAIGLDASQNRCLWHLHSRHSLKFFSSPGCPLHLLMHKSPESPALGKFVSSIQSDARILNLWKPNSALSFKAFDIWGYDPGVPKRYAEFIAFTQGENPQKASQYANIRNPSIPSVAENASPSLSHRRRRGKPTCPGISHRNVADQPDSSMAVYQHRQKDS